MSTLPTAKPDHRKLPRKKRAPSSRDQAILVAHRVHGRTQADLANEYRLTQSRISAIVRRVEKWRAGVFPSVDEELDGRERQRLERWVERERLQAVHSRAMRAYDTQPAELVTVREGHRDGKPFKEETHRQQAPNVQLLKTALRAAVDLGKLNDKPEPPPPEPHDACGRWWHIHEQLCELRRDARAKGELDGDEDDGRESSRVNQWMKALTGHNSVESISAAQGANEVAASNCTTCTNPTAEEARETPVIEPAALASSASHEPTSDPGLRTMDSAAAPSQKKKPAIEQQPPSPAERRRRHQEKLEQLREARRLGMPYQFVFDPEDGPIPRPTYQLDGVGYE